jgi:predicted GTPase
MGAVVYAGVDYEKILRQAEAEADVVVWDGGNNDTPFFKPNVAIVVFDPHRPGHETTYFPGETNMLMADIAVINKVDSADSAHVDQLRRTISDHNPGADIILANSLITADNPLMIKGRRVLVIEDGPTVTHGEMAYGAGIIAARRFGAAEIIDPRPNLRGSLVDTFAAYPGIGSLLPAMGYSRQQIKDLEDTINSIDCDVLVSATPIDLTRMVQIRKPVVRIRYEYQDRESRTLASVLGRRLGIGE